MSWSSQKKEEGIFCTIYFVQMEFLRFVFYLNVWCIEYTFTIYILLHIKNIHKLLLLVSKIVESLQCIVNFFFYEKDLHFSVFRGVFLFLSKSRLYMTLKQH